MGRQMARARLPLTVKSVQMTAPPDHAVQIYAAADGRRVAVSGLQPSQQGQEYVSVPLAEAPMPPSLVQRAKGPFMGLTLLATAAVAAWQSNRLYRQRQQSLLDDFGATMVFHMGDDQEMRSTIKQFRQQLGPGSYRGAMFQAFVVALSADAPISVEAIKTLNHVAQMMRLTNELAATCLEGAAADLKSQPSVLGKLTFIAERGMPTAASIAKLRSRFPNWSLDTVTALQRAMLENHFRDTYCDGELVAGSDTLELLGLSEVLEKKEAAQREADEKAAEDERAKQLQEALESAASSKRMKTISTSRKTETNDSDDESDDASDDASDDEPEEAPREPIVKPAFGTHEYECTECGYILFPAAGRESKFFGADFLCPQCGAGKEAFVDNGPVDADA
ncbi:MAG: hypothetical protein SGPRY_000250 [Prymnesium sp.]